MLSLLLVATFNETARRPCAGYAQAVGRKLVELHGRGIDARHRLGLAFTQQHLAQIMLEKGWGATMVLTEPDAGSDVGAGRTKAVQQPDGTWHLDGVKRFALTLG